MSEQHTFELSRRKTLASLGAIGVASAGAGFGTSAYFSDEESFDGNTLTAGELDLKVDWTEHYYDGSESLWDDVGTVSSDPGTDLLGFPSTAPMAEKTVYVEDEQQFMANTAIEAFPDVLDEEDDYDAQKEPIDDDICDLPADLDGVLSHPFRTRGTYGGDLNPQTTEEGDALVNISDVKPGDFGEVTFSFHLCGNPGYVWLTGDLVDASENGLTEPEAESEHEEEGVVELLDEIRVALWYDTGADGTYGPDLDDKDEGEGDNVFGPGETLIPLTGSLRSVLRALEGDMFMLDPQPITGGNGDVGAGGAEVGGVSMVSGEIGEDTAEIDETIITGEDEDRFGGTRNYTCADYEDNLPQFEEGDLVGSEVLNPDDGQIVEGASYSGCTTLTVDDLDDDTGSITLSTSGSIQIVSVKGGPDGEQVYVFDESVILDGATFTTPGNFGLSNVDVCCPVDGDDNGDNGDISPLENGDQCFQNSTTAYLGFEWWVPTHVGNQIQTDSVSFDIGFYTEQCRHNDDPGQTRDDGEDDEQEVEG